MKKFLAIILLSIITLLPIHAKNIIDTTGIIKHDFNTSCEIPKIISFTPYEDIIIPDVVEIPKNSLVSAEILKYQKELRWHKSAFLIIKVLSYKSENQKKPTVLKNQDVILVLKKYKRYDGKEASIIATEILGSSAVSFFAPGVDIAYFFLKGAIVRDMHPNWFKSGVSKAYDNSLLWFIERGKNMNLDENDEIKIEYYTQKKLDKTVKKVEKRELKQEKKQAKKKIKNEKKELKASLKAEKEKTKQAKMKPKKLEKYLAKQDKKAAKKEKKAEKKQLQKEKFEARYKAWEEKWDAIEDKRTEELKQHAERKKQKRAEKLAKKEEKAALKAQKKAEKLAKKEEKKQAKSVKKELSVKAKIQK